MSDEDVALDETAVSEETGAVPTGLAGFTSSRGAFLSVVGDDFGSGPSKVSGGLTRRGRDCASTLMLKASSVHNVVSIKGNVWLFIGSNSFRFVRMFPTVTGREPQTMSPMR